MIPLRMPVLEWEQLGGHLLRVAGELGCPLRAVTFAAGTPARAGNGLAGLSALPDEEAIRAVSDFLGLAVADVQQMTLHRFRPRLFGHANATVTAGTNPEAPFMLTGGVYCPKCVAAGHWDLRWKTGLVAVCTEHRRYVRSRCPVCGVGVAPETMWTPLFAGDDTLRHGLSESRTCDGLLAENKSPVDVRHLHAQELVNRLLDSAQFDANAAARCRDVLRWLEYLHRGTRDRGFMSGGLLAPDGPELADLLMVSRELASHLQDALANPRLAGAVHLQRAVGRSPSKAPLYAPLGDGEDLVLETIKRAAAAPVPVVSVPMPGLRGDATTLPKVIPQSLFTAALSDPLHFVGYDRARAVAAMSVAAPAGQPFFRDVARSMGIPDHLGATSGQALAYLEVVGTADSFWAAVDDVRRKLRAAGIDFAARARAVEQNDAVLAAARQTWPQLHTVGNDSLRQWLMDRWACQYHATVGRAQGWLGRLADRRGDVDALINDEMSVANLWRTWEPAVTEAHGVAS